MQNERFYCPERTHFVPDGKQIEVGSLVMHGSVIGLVRGLRTKTRSFYPYDRDNGKQQAFVTGLRATQGIWWLAEDLVGGAWVPIESCEDGGQI